MSPPLTSRSEDLARLVREGYALEVRSALLLVHDVPYATADRRVQRGTLVSTLHLAGDVTLPPDTHVMSFIGDTPCDANGRPLEQIFHGGPARPAPDVAVDRSFSSKPTEGYPDYYAKVTTYVNILGTGARQLDPTATAKTYRVAPEPEDSSVFHYLDTSVARAGIGAVSARLEVSGVAVVGLGGTGSYVLDLLAKAPIREIHLYDADRLAQHNAFRAPGAASIEDLQGGPLKVDYFTARYAPMRRGIIPHPQHVDSSNADTLATMDCVFVCVDNGSARRSITEALERLDIPFIDVGMGLHLTPDGGSLIGQVRVTTSLPGRRTQARRHLPLEDTDPVVDVYRSNIQVAELNALNAVLAVLRWKRMRGFYLDTEDEQQTVYLPDGNTIINAETADRATGGDQTTIQLPAPRAIIESETTA